MQQGLDWIYGQFSTEQHPLIYSRDLLTWPADFHKVDQAYWRENKGKKGCLVQVVCRNFEMVP
jgi:hypothetical protein